MPSLMCCKRALLKVLPPLNPVPLANQDNKRPLLGVVPSPLCTCTHTNTCT